MTVNVGTETEIDLNIKKLDEMLGKIKLLEDKSKMLQFITIRRICKT